MNEDAARTATEGPMLAKLAVANEGTPTGAVEVGIASEAIALKLSPRDASPVKAPVKTRIKAAIEVPVETRIEASVEMSGMTAPAGGNDNDVGEGSGREGYGCCRPDEQGQKCVRE